MAAPGAGRGLTRGLSGLPRGAISRKVNPATPQTVENSKGRVYNSAFLLVLTVTDLFSQI